MSEEMDRIYKEDKDKYNKSDLRIRSAGKNPKKLSEAAKQHPDYKPPEGGQSSDPTGPNYVGPSNLGNMPRSAMGEAATLGAAAALVFKPGTTISTGINLAFPDAEGELFEKAIRGKMRAATTVAKFGIKQLSGKLDEWLNPNIWRNNGNAYGPNWGPGAMNINQPFDRPKTSVGDGGKRFNWKDIPGNTLWKGGQPDPKVTAKVDALLDMLDDWRISHSHLDRPMTGFVKEYGRKPTFWQDGKELGIGWSRKKNTYEIFDVQSRIDSRASRLAGDKTSNPESASLRQIKEAFKRDLNKQAAELPVEQWDIMIQNPGDAYVEHLIAVKSPFWKTQRGKNAGYLAGDSKNLKVLTDQNFKKLKDNVERHVHAKHKHLYVDYDPTSQNLVLKDLKTGKALKTQIPGIGDPTQTKSYVADAIEGRPMRSIDDIDPKVPANVKRQIQKAYFEDLDDITSNAIIDRIRGDSWTEIRSNYGTDFSKRQLSLATERYNKLTQSEVTAIMNAYKLGGKGRTRY